MPITGLNANVDPDCKVFHAGTNLDEQGQIVTAGGRVLCVCALADDIVTAQQKAYALCTTINWQDIYYRTDIGFKAIGR